MLVYWVDLAGVLAGLLGRFGWFIGQEAACFFLRLTYRRDRPCRDPLKKDSGRYAITLIELKISMVIDSWYIYM